MNGVRGPRPGCPAAFHGTKWARNQHGCACPDTVRALSVENKRYRMGYRRLVSPVGAQRRLRALAAIGWSAQRLAAEVGRTEGWIKLLRNARSPSITRTTELRIQALYERLGGTPGPSAEARRAAGVRKWAPPLAWYGRDIDDPKVYPSRGHNRRGPLPGEPEQSEIDDVIAGRTHLYTLPPRYRTQVVDRMLQWHLPMTTIAERLDIPERTVWRYRTRLAHEAEQATA